MTAGGLRAPDRRVPARRRRRRRARPRRHRRAASAWGSWAAGMLASRRAGRASPRGSGPGRAWRPRSPAWPRSPRSWTSCTWPTPSSTASCTCSCSWRWRGSARSRSPADARVVAFLAFFMLVAASSASFGVSFLAVFLGYLLLATWLLLLQHLLVEAEPAPRRAVLAGGPAGSARGLLVLAAAAAATTLAITAVLFFVIPRVGLAALPFRGKIGPAGDRVQPSASSSARTARSRPTRAWRCACTSPRAWRIRIGSPICAGAGSPTTSSTGRRGAWASPSG